MPPSGAAFSSGMMICAHPELNVPMTRDHRVVRRIRVAVLRALARVPLRGLRGRVVARLEADVVVAGLPFTLLELVADRRDDLLGLRARRALEREVGRQDVIGIAFALVLESPCTTTTARASTSPPPSSPPPQPAATRASSRDQQRERNERASLSHSQPVLLTLIARIRAGAAGVPGVSALAPRGATSDVGETMFPPRAPFFCAWGKPCFPQRAPLLRPRAQRTDATRLPAGKAGLRRHCACAHAQRLGGSGSGERRVTDQRPMPEVGVEPTRPEGHRILSPARLPVPPLRRGQVSDDA